MNTSKLNDSKLNNSQIDYAELDILKIREFIKLLEEHQEKCEKGGRFVEAEMSKQRVAQFKKIEEDKLLNETKRTHEEQKIILERDQKDELDRFNEQWDQEFYVMSGKFNEGEAKVKQMQQEELEERLSEYEKSLPVTPKPSIEILNLNKILELSVKQKDYTKAHQVQVQVAELTGVDGTKFLEEREKKIRNEAERLKTKHDNEMNAYNLKTQSAYNQFKKNRAIEFDKMILRYKNKLKELENNQKLEVSNFSKILKGISRPNSRISNIMKSASNIHNLNSNPSNYRGFRDTNTHNNNNNVVNTNAHNNNEINENNENNEENNI